MSVWEIISGVYDIIGKPIDSVKELEAKVENDDKVWNLYRDGITSTMNQVSTDSGRKQVMDFKPQSVGELSGWVAAIRPGFASLKEEYFRRKPHHYNVESLDEILSDTNGYLIFQESIMKMLVWAGIPEDETYTIIKGISKKKPEIVNVVKEQFFNGATDRITNEGYDKEKANDVVHDLWQIMIDASSYSFNASHSYSVALDSVYGAYLKAYYPIEYYTVVFNIYEDDSDVTRKLVSELPYFNIKLQSIEFGKSQSEYSYDKETNTIYKGLSSIKFMNDNVAEEMNTIHSKQYDNFAYVIRDVVESTKIDTRQFKILISLNYFSDYGTPNLLMNIAKNGTGDKEAVYLPIIQDEIMKIHQEEFNEWFEKDKNKTPKQLQNKKNTLTKVVYDKGLKSKDKRLNNLLDYEYIIKDKWSNNKVDLYEQIKNEFEYFGYGVTLLDNVSNRYIVMGLNLKYSPIIELYDLTDGSLVKYRMQKNKFYSDDGMLLQVGDIVAILNKADKPQVRKDNETGDWIEVPGKSNTWINKVKIWR